MAARKGRPGKTPCVLNGGLDMQKLGIPKHKRLQLLLEEKILQGVYRPDEKLPTEKELMAAYGLSYATVSRALKDLARAGFVRRRRGSGTFVTDRPLQAPISSLAPQFTKTIAHFHGGVPFGFHPYFSALIEGFVAAASEHDMFVKFAAAPKADLGLDEEFLQRHGIAGFSVSMILTSQLETALRCGFPVVTLSGQWESLRVDRVTMNQALRLLLVFEHLRDLGHERLAVVHSKGMPDVAEILAEVFDCLPGSKRVDAVAAEGWDRKAGQRAVKALLKLRPKPTAVYVTDDFLLMHFLRELGVNGVRVPRDVSVVGAGTPFSHMMIGRAVTMVEVDPVEVARAAVDLLAEQIETRRPPGKLVRVIPKLVVRETSAAAGK